MQFPESSNLNISPAVPVVLALLVSMGVPAHADTLYKCRDASGAVLYTNQKGTARRCTVLSTDQPITTVPAAKQATRNTTPGDFPCVDGNTQRGRDGDRRKILEQELATELLNLEKSRKALADGEATRHSDEKNYQKYQVNKDDVALHERNVEALKRELANLK